MNQVYVVLFKIDGINSTRVFSDIDKASAFIKTIDGYKTVFIETIDRGMNEIDNKCDNAVGCCQGYCGLCKDFPTAKDRKNCLAYKEKAKLVRRSMYEAKKKANKVGGDDGRRDHYNR